MNTTTKKKVIKEMIRQSNWFESRIIETNCTFPFEGLCGLFYMSTSRERNTLPEIFALPEFEGLHPISYIDILEDYLQLMLSVDKNAIVKAYAMRQRTRTVFLELVLLSIEK